MIVPYITFYGSCREALDFYCRVFRSEIKTIQHYGKYAPGDLDVPPVDLSAWVLHAEMQICGTVFWFADETHPVSKGDMIQLTLPVSTAAEAKAIFDRLAEGGEVTLPPAETFYSSFHAAVTDRYGVGWNVVAEEEPS